MANDNKEIGDVVKKSKILLLDIEGTTTSISFVKDKLFPYVEEHVKQFLDKQWDKDNVKEAVSALRKLAVEDQEKGVDGFVSIPGEDASKEDQIEGLVKNVKWQMSSDRKAGALKQLQGLIWKQGYDNGDIKGHVYDDVLPALEQWRSVEGQKVYIYSSGSVQAQKLLFGQSSAGDLLGFIDGHFDTVVGAKQEVASYTAITEKIGCKSDEILFLTDIPKEAEAAREAGLNVALVSREGNAPLSEEATAAFSVLHSFTQLTVTNKRKTEPQDEIPAKVPKTKVENDVKSTSEPEPETKEVEKTKEPEKMDVDEQPVTADEKTNGENKIENVPVHIKTVVEELPDSTPVDAPICDKEPVVIEENIEESNEKTEKKEETEKMITDSTEIKTEEDTSLTKEKIEEKNSEEKAPPVAEETPPVVVTEIEEISDDKASLSEVAEIIDDLEPVVEEPAAVEEIEQLQNVGEVLEKECDEILSKVKDVTNLDNLPLKPLLNPIPEETMETDNVDSNDIVDRILDTELELEMKQCESIDLNTVTEITDEKKTEAVEEPSVKEDIGSTEQKEVPKENTAENIVENNIAESNVTQEKVEESSPTEPKTENTEATKTESTETKTDNTETKIENTETKIENTETKTEKPETKTENTETKTENTETKTQDTETKKENEKEAQKLESESKEEPTKQSTSAESETGPETKESDTAAEELPSESKSETELHVNGKATNGDTDTVNVNGDASKDEELNARLSVENGKEQVNGSNGDSMETEQGQGDSKVEPEVSDIKVKTVSDVATDEPRTDPIEQQPTEA